MPIRSNSTSLGDIPESVRSLILHLRKICRFVIVFLCDFLKQPADRCVHSERSSLCGKTKNRGIL